MLSWLIPVAGFILVNGLLGVTTKLALSHVTWPQLIVWVALAYAVISGGLLLGGAGFTVNGGTVFAILNGVMAASAVVLLFVALGAGDVSRVIPIGAAYPAVTVFAAAVLLDEPLSPVRIGGTALVVAGVILVSTETEDGSLLTLRHRTGADRR